MAHVGKDFPYFFWRDLCGEFPQRGFFILPKRWGFSALSGGSGTYVSFLNSTRPRSYPGERDGWNPIVEWTWDTTGTSDYTGLYCRMEWDAEARILYEKFEAYWGSGGLASMTCEFSPPKANYVAWTGDQTYLTSTTTDSAKWSWGVGSHRSVELRHAGWPDEPNP